MPGKQEDIPERDQIFKRLRDEFNYSEPEARALIDALASSRTPVKQAFAEWWFTGRLDTLEVGGWTAQKIVDHLGCHPPAAIVNLDWLLTEPDAARAALERGFDRVASPGTKLKGN